MTEPVVPPELDADALEAARRVLHHEMNSDLDGDAVAACIRAYLEMTAVARPALPAPEPPLLRRLQTARIALGGATATRRETGAHVREMDADVWDKWCDELRAIEMALRGAAPAPPDPKESHG